MINPRAIRLAKRLRAALPSLPFVEALTTGQAIARGEDEGLIFRLEDEHEAWDGDCPAPRYLYWAAVSLDGEDETLASLGMIGVNDMDDPYLTILKGELFGEALETIDAEREQASHVAAAELMSRATYAAG